MQDTEIQVSVICLAYNHEPYIRKCLEGFVSQQTSFAFEVLINDDASTDQTAQIIREYEAKYPDIIKPVYQTENQYSKHIGITNTILIPRAKGRFIAFCEGDDYWTDPCKLQKQFDALEAHPEVDMCAHGAVMVQADTEEVIGQVRPGDRDRLLTTEEVILGDGAYLATNSLFYRAELAKNPMEFRKTYPLDYSLQIMGALRGGIWYLSDTMSAYRYMVKGSWTARNAAKKSSRLRSVQFIRDMLVLADKNTGGKFHAQFDTMIKHYEFGSLWIQEDFKAMLDPKYAETLSKQALFSRITIRLRAWFPVLTHLKH